MVRTERATGENVIPDLQGRSDSLKTHICLLLDGPLQPGSGQHSAAPHLRRLSSENEWRPRPRLTSTSSGRADGVPWPYRGGSRTWLASRRRIAGRTVGRGPRRELTQRGRGGPGAGGSSADRRRPQGPADRSRFSRAEQRDSAPTIRARGGPRDRMRRTSASSAGSSDPGRWTQPARDPRQLNRQLHLDPISELGVVASELRDIAAPDPGSSATLIIFRSTTSRRPHEPDPQR
jgi:hypothetical protein